MPEKESKEVGKGQKKKGEGSRQTGAQKRKQFTKDPERQTADIGLNREEGISPEGDISKIGRGKGLHRRGRTSSNFSGKI